MGYTHYYRTTPNIPSDKWAKLTTAVNKVLADQTILRQEFNMDEPPMVNDEVIRFNGIGEDGHETFYLAKNDTPAEWSENQNEVFNFCKTARKPYDKYVTAVLFLAKIHLTDDIRLGSDGYISEWQNGVDLVNEKLDKNYAMIENPVAEYPDSVDDAIIKTGVKLEV